MSGTTPNLGLTIATSSADQFDWQTYLNDNLTLIDNQFSALSVSTVPIRFLENLSSVPATNLSQGRLVYLTAASSGFSGNQIIQYNGTYWQNVGPHELVSSVPGSSNYSGRNVTLNTSNGPWQAFDTIVCTDGVSTWKRIDNDTLLSIASFRALAGYPDGIKALVQADSTNGINWLFRNNANSGSIYKFEAYAGQTALYQEIDTLQTTTSLNSWVDLASVGPSIQIPLTGEYEIKISATFVSPSGGAAQGYITFNDGAGNVYLPQAPGYIGAASKSSRFTVILPRIALTRGNTCKIQYQTDTSGFGWQQRVLQITPLRVNQS